MTEEVLESPSSEEQQQAVAEPEADNQTEQTPQEAPEGESHEESTVPLTALQKERRRRQEIERQYEEVEERLRRIEQSQYSYQKEDDSDAYESLTKGEYQQLTKQQEMNLIRKVSESQWVKQHPDKVEIINEKLPELLKKRPNLAHAIAAAENRYLESWEILQRFNETPKKRETPKEQAPGSPAAAPKAKSPADGMDVMSMSDEDFRKWMALKSRRRSF